MTTATYTAEQLHEQQTAAHSPTSQPQPQPQPQQQPPPHVQPLQLHQHSPERQRHSQHQHALQQLPVHIKQEAHGLPLSLTLPPSPHDGGGAIDSILPHQPASVSAPATLQHPLELSAASPSSSSSSSSSHSRARSQHSPTYTNPQPPLASTPPLTYQQLQQLHPQPFQQPHPQAPLVQYSRPPFFPRLGFPPPPAPGSYPPQQQQPVPAAASSNFSPRPQHSTPPMSYHSLPQQHHQQPQHQQHQGGSNAQSHNSRAYAAAPSAHHQANSTYSGFYPPAYQQANLPLVSGGYGGHNQAAAAHVQMVKQQQQQHHQQQQTQHGGQQPPPFSPSSLQHLLGGGSSSQQHSSQPNHLSTHINVNLAPAAFPAQSASHSQAPTLSSDLLYVNQRYHDLVYKLALHMKKMDEQHHHQHPVLIEDILRCIREEVNIYHAQQLNRLSAIKPEHLLSSPLSTSLSTLSSLSGAYMSNSGAMAQTDRLFCKPSRLISQFNKKPFKLLMVQIQRQYTSSKKELDAMKEREKEKLIAIRVRLMGAPLRGHVYFVAKDLCQLIHSRKGNVAKGKNHETHTLIRRPNTVLFSDLI